MPICCTTQQCEKGATVWETEITAPEDGNSTGVSSDIHDFYLDDYFLKYLQTYLHMYMCSWVINTNVFDGRTKFRPSLVSIFQKNVTVITYELYHQLTWSPIDSADKNMS